MNPVLLNTMLKRAAIRRYEGENGRSKGNDLVFDRKDGFTRYVIENTWFNHKTQQDAADAETLDRIEQYGPHGQLIASYSIPWLDILSD